MNRILLLLPVCAVSMAQYVPYYAFYADLLTASSANWGVNGAVSFTTSGLAAPDANGGALIYGPAAPPDQEVKATLGITASGGTFVLYLRASGDGRLSPTIQTGSFYAIEFSPTPDGACTGLISLRKVIGGSGQLIAMSYVPCRDGMILRASIRNDGLLLIDYDGIHWNGTTVQDLPEGKPGIGAYATAGGNSIKRVELGAVEYRAPNPQRQSVRLHAAV
jgi:hypothetical protein